MNNLYNKILNEVYLIQGFDSWDNSENAFKNSITKSLSPQLIYKIDEPQRIKIFKSSYTEYKDKVYIEGEHVQLEVWNGCTVNKYKPGEYRVHIEDFDNIESYAFYNCTELISVIIPNSVTSIGEWAFYNCSSLASVTIPNSVTTIGGSAFTDCSGLISVAIPNSVKEIGNAAFYGCSGLTSVAIGNSVTTIDKNAFYESKDLKKVYVEDINKFKKIRFGNEYSDPTYYGAELIELKK